MTLLSIVNIFFLNILVSLILGTLIGIFVPGRIQEPFRVLVRGLRQSLVSFGRILFPGETMEIEIVVRVIIPFFLLIYIARMIVVLIPNLEDYQGVQIVLIIMVVFLFINSVPVDSEWDVIFKPDASSVLSLTVKTALIDQQVTNPVLDYKLFLGLLIYPFSYHLSFLNHTEDTENTLTAVEGML